MSDLSPSISFQGSKHHNQVEGSAIIHMVSEDEITGVVHVNITSRYATVVTKDKKNLTIPFESIDHIEWI